jgi:hypothetical protein
MCRRNTNTNSKCNANGNIYADCNPDAQTCSNTQASPESAASANTAKSVRLIIRRQV